MSIQQDFINQGFSVIDTEKTENKLLQFLKEHYPQTIVGEELKIEELKAILGIPVDEKTNGYGLNFVGRNVARAKYAQPTQKELRLNTTLSKDIDTTQNLVLKGDNLDSLKILKNHYTGKIKCIYIDPPYNTQSDNFVYPDKFDKEEAEVLGIAENLSDEDFARMEFSFSSKKSHNGWLAFMYPRLLLARDLLSQDGVIFISIDDNEQANLKILCDEIFGEENFVGLMTIQSNPRGSQSSKFLSNVHEYILMYSKNANILTLKGVNKSVENIGEYSEEDDEKRKYRLLGLRQRGGAWKKEDRPLMHYPIYVNPSNGNVSLEKSEKFSVEVIPQRPTGELGRWTWGKERLLKDIDLVIGKKINRIGVEEVWDIFRKDYLLDTNGNEKTAKIKTIWLEKEINYQNAKNEIKELFYNSEIFDYPKPTYIVKRLLSMLHIGDEDDIILDFFAGSGTTGHAVMALNAEDGGNRKFILCQIDEPIAENKPAYQFCIDNGLPPVISSITIERLKRASLTLNPSPKERETEGGTPKKEEISNTQNLLSEMPEEALNTKNSHTQTPPPSEGAGGRIGFKVFDHINSPKLTIEQENILFPELEIDALSRIYNMIFSVGIDEPSQTPEVVQEDSVYRIGNHYYITHSEKVSKEDFAKYLSPENKVFVDGWTASLNATLQHYKEEVKIVF